MPVLFTLINDDGDVRRPVDPTQRFGEVDFDNWMLVAHVGEAAPSITGPRPGDAWESIVGTLPSISARAPSITSPHLDDVPAPAKQTVAEEEEEDESPESTTGCLGGGSVRWSTAEITLVEYNFILGEETFALKFAPGDKVGDARKRIQERFGIPDIADVTLIFGGKDLRDAFVLDRLRVGTRQILVHRRDRSEVLLHSAVARLT
jgi:hypothetical protein